MARIRTIKPEFPQSESLARVSRDARLCFVGLWTICDDEGRARGNARMLASLLFPYDEDAPGQIESWLAELERVDAIRRYEAEGKSYLAVTAWTKHQRIDRPTPSKLPAPPNAREASRALVAASPPEGKGGERNGPGEEGIDTAAEADAVRAYNAVASELNWPRVQRLTPARKARLAQRLRECGGADGWRAAMARARASPFLRGETRRDAAHANWTPDFDFLIQQGSITRLMEGKYDERNSSGNPTGFHALLAGARAAIDG